MPSNLALKTSDGASDLGPLDYSGTDRGTTTAATAFRLLNDDSGGTVDTASDPYLEVLQDDGAGNALRSGERGVDEHWAEIRALGTGSSGSTQQATGWQPVGKDRRFMADALASGEYSDFEIRVRIPSNAPIGSWNFYLDAEADSAAEAVSNGITDGRRDGLLSGIGDASWDHVIIGGDVVEDDAGAGADVDVPDLAWVIDGVPWVKLAHEITTNDTDGDSATTSAGEAYYLLLSLANDGTITETKGSKATAPLDPTTDAPSLPAGEIALALIERNDDGVINDADITQQYLLGRFGATTSAASLDVTLGPGRAVIDNSLIRLNINTTVTLTASSTNGVWLQVDGTFAVETDGERPTPRAVKLWEFTTDGSGVTAETDLRDPIGGQLVPLTLQFSSVADTTEAFTVQPMNRDVYVRPYRGCVFGLHTNGSGNTTGITAVDIEKSVGGAAYVDLFTSKGSDDRRPTVEHDDSDSVDRLALPEVLKIEPGALVRATIDRTEAYDGTAPADGATLTILCEMF